MNRTGVSAEFTALERMLRERRQQAESRLETLLGRSEEECRLSLDEDVFGAREEAMLEEINAEVDARLNADIHQLRRELAEIEAALKRHADATYGICGHCGRAIAVDRLFSDPTSVRCGSCEATHSAPETRVA